MCSRGLSPTRLLTWIHRTTTVVLLVNVLTQVSIFFGSPSLKLLRVFFSGLQIVVLALVGRLLFVFRPRLRPLGNKVIVPTAVAVICVFIVVVVGNIPVEYEHPNKTKTNRTPSPSTEPDESKGKHDVIITVSGNIALMYYIFLLCYVVPQVKKILTEAPSEELIDERYYILSPKQVVVSPRIPDEDGIELPKQQIRSTYVAKVENTK